MTDCMCRGCNAGSGGSMHYIPKDPEIREKWIDFIYKNRPAPKFKNLDRIRICSAHFTEESFTNYRQKMMGFGKRLILKPNAVPTIAVQTEFTAPSRTRRERVQEVVAEMRLCPLCQQRQNDAAALSWHLTKKHSVHAACLHSLLVSAPYVSDVGGVVGISTSQTFDGTSEEKPNTPLTADWSSQGNNAHNAEEGNTGSRCGRPEASSLGDESNNKVDAAADGGVNHRSLRVFTPTSARNVQNITAGAGNDGNSSTAHRYVSAKPYQCDVCHVSYVYSFGLESHLKSVLHHSRSRKAEHAAASSRTNAETRVVVGSPLVNGAQLSSTQACDCVTLAKKVQLQPAPLPVLTLAPNPRLSVPSVIPAPGTWTTRLIRPPQTLIRPPGAPRDGSGQTVGRGAVKSHPGETSASGRPMETSTSVDGAGGKVKVEFKEEPCDREISQPQSPRPADATDRVSLKQESVSVWGGAADGGVSLAEEPAGLDGNPTRRRSTAQDTHEYPASEPCRASTAPPELTEFQSQVLWALIESQNEADSRIPPREDREALGREVGLTEEEVQKWLMATCGNKDRRGAGGPSSYERQGSTGHDKDALMMARSGGPALCSAADSHSHAAAVPDEHAAADKKRKRGMD